MTPGFWHSTFFCIDFWPTDFWPEHGIWSGIEEAETVTTPWSAPVGDTDADWAAFAEEEAAEWSAPGGDAEATWSEPAEEDAVVWSNVI